MPRLSTFGTLTFTNTSTYDAAVAWADDTPYSGQVDLRPRRSRHPVRDSFHLSERTLQVTILNRGQAAANQFWRDVFRTFAPVPSQQTLTGTHDQTGGTISLDVDVTRIVRSSDAAFSEMRVDCLAADPLWKDTTASTVTATGGTVVNSGDFPALPQMVITPNFNWLTRRRITVSDNTGRGLANYFIRAPVPTNGTNGISAANQAVVYYKGRSIPFGIGYPTGAAGTIGGTATALDFRIDVPPNGSSYVDVYYGTCLANSDTSNRLNYGELYSTSNDLGNGTVVWHDMFVTTAPAAATWSWVPAKVGQSISGITSGLTAEGTTLYSPSIGGVRFQVANDSSLPNDIDGMVMVVGADCAFNGLNSLERRFYTNGGCRAFVRYRQADQLVWQDAWTATTAGTYTADLQVSFGVQICVGIEPITAGASGTLDIINGNVAGTYLTIRVGTPPTVSVGGTALAYLLNGTHTNSTTGASIRFGTVLMDGSDTLSIDTYAQTMSTSGTTPFYGDIVPSDADNWFPWSVGSNALAGTFGGTPSWVYKRRWIM